MKMSSFKSNWMGKFNQQLYLRVPQYSLESGYFNKHLPEINRFGIFRHLENCFDNKKQERVMSIHHAQTHYSDLNDKVYRLQTEQTIRSKKNLLISLYFDEVFQPLSLIESSLKKIQDSKDFHSYEDVYFHIDYGIKTLKGQNIEYLHSAFRLMSSTLEKELKFIDYTDLFKIYDMREWSYFEGDLVWHFSDSFMKHLCLSKGAQLIEEKDHSFIEEKKIMLSPYYSIAFGKMDKIHECKKLEDAKKSGHGFFNDHKDQLRQERSLLFRFLYEPKK